LGQDHHVKEDHILLLKVLSSSECFDGRAAVSNLFELVHKGRSHDGSDSEHLLPGWDYFSNQNHHESNDKWNGDNYVDIGEAHYDENLDDAEDSCLDRRHVANDGVIYNLKIGRKPIDDRACGCHVKEEVDWGSKH
jgi:hypothetical protein